MAAPVWYLRVALLIAGATALVALVIENDPAAILGSITQLSWRLGVVVLLHALVAVFDALGWRFAFPAARVPFLRLMAVRLAGEAVNMTTPTAAVGGEPVKAWLLRADAPVGETVASIIVAKTTITVAQGLFLLLGVAVAATRLPSGSPLFLGMVWLLVTETLALSIFLLAQVRGLLGGLGRLVGRVRLPTSLQRVDVLLRANEVLERFYREQPGRLVLSTSAHFLGWLLGVVETLLILHFLGVDASVGTAVVIEALATGIRFVAFFIPAGLGALEGGLLVAFGALGLGPTTALSFSLVRRLREAVWIGVGLVALFRASRAVPRGPESSSNNRAMSLDCCSN